MRWRGRNKMKRKELDEEEGMRWRGRNRMTGKEWDGQEGLEADRKELYDWDGIVSAESKYSVFINKERTDGREAVVKYCM